MSKQDAYRRKAEAKLEEKRAELDQVMAKAKAAGADAEVEAREAMDDLEGKFAEARGRLRKLADAGEDAWDDLTKGFEDAWQDVSGAVKKVISRFS